MPRMDQVPFSRAHFPAEMDELSAQRLPVLGCFFGGREGERRQGTQGTTKPHQPDTIWGIHRVHAETVTEFIGRTNNAQRLA